MKAVHCSFAQHGKAILEIFNEVIENSTALYDYKARQLQQVQDWFEIKESKLLPVIGYEDDDGTLMGFASYGSFRHFPAYKYTVEHSIYVHQDYRRCGLGKRLLADIMQSAQAQDYHVVIGALDQDNLGSIALHEQMGFTLCGTVEQAAFKFGRWLNLALYQKILSTPLQPHDDF